MTDPDVRRLVRGGVRRRRHPHPTSTDPNGPDSVSQFLLRACGLGGSGTTDGPDPATADQLTSQDESEASDGEVGAQILRDSRQIVDRIYAHINSWLSRHTDAQIIIVDNQPPADQDMHVVVRYSGDSEQPPYGLIDDATT